MPEAKELPLGLRALKCSFLDQRFVTLVSVVSNENATTPLPVVLNAPNAANTCERPLPSASPIATESAALKPPATFVVVFPGAAL